ncbi:IS1595 family transposase [Collinsella stercoris]|uniref:IS1595 family transposase n=1 Tax=Collinsella stercoris TaxID=147206 RepID=UPI00248D6445|nr:IS1595 family transposase [Collinsella stercoris]
MSSKKAPKNKYVKNSHLSERKLRELPRLFCADVTALSAASLTGLNRSTANRRYGMLRARIAEACEADSPFDGEVEADEGHFGARRVRGVRGRGARGKAIVFGLPKRGGKVCARIVPDVARRTSTQVVEGKVSKDSIMCADGFAPCDGLVGWGCRHHYGVGHGENESVERGNPGNHINGIEGFWGYAKNRLVRYQGMPKEDFCLHLRECGLRFNMRGRDMYKFMLRELRERPLN